ncbi:probable L-gulonolactone oxidase 6 isoform X3 [Coffea arabica]|uniref:L-gulonolactone oxidase n=2 Tax=Coffea arabica TaxID=13443 RepID=A0A6P6UXH6_COFAR
MAKIQFVVTYWICLTICLVGCTPPEDHIKCSSGNTNCTITNTYATFPDRSICRAAEAMYPKSEQELISIVANATSLQRKMKVATTTSHSIPKLMCPGGENGIIISTKYLNRTVNVDKSAMTITVEPGVTLRQLINASAAAGLALPYAPYWWGLTVGGMLGTGAHGSTLWGLGSAVHDYVIQLRIVTPAGPDEGYAKVRTLRNGDPELNAARVSLGVLGVISQVTLQLQPLFKRSITYVQKNDSDFGDQASTFGRQHEFADFTWYPSQHKVVYRIDDRVPSNTTGNGLYDFMGFRSTPSLFLALIRTAEETQESIRDAVGKCINGGITTSILTNAAYGLTNDGSMFKGYPVVGYNNRLQSSGSCLDSPQDGLITACPWDPRVKGLYYFQNGFSIGLSKVKDFIQDVQKLVSLQPRALCGVDLYDGFLIRYVTASSAYLGKQEDALDFDITYYRSKDPMAPRLYEDILEEIEQMAVIKYGGLPHWGKNRNLAFVGAINKYQNATEFLKVKQLYDPLGLFSNEWTDQILGIKDGITIMKDGCALEGLCICSQDSHCAPQKGYFCRPGKVYTDARVCTRLSS